MSMHRTDLIYQSTKTYTHAHGFSCAFRQWKAASHCSLLHGYSLQITLTFEAEPDERNWVQDFGGLKEVKTYLEGMFDHTLLVAEDDPKAPILMLLHEARLARVVYVKATGCEKFAEMILNDIDNFHPDIGKKLVQVDIAEHGGNSARVIRKHAPKYHHVVIDEPTDSEAAQKASKAIRKSADTVRMKPRHKRKEGIL